MRIAAHILCTNVPCVSSYEGVIDVYLIRHSIPFFSSLAYSPSSTISLSLFKAERKETSGNQVCQSQILFANLNSERDVFHSTRVFLFSFLLFFFFYFFRTSHRS